MKNIIIVVLLSVILLGSLYLVTTKNTVPSTINKDNEMQNTSTDSTINPSDTKYAIDNQEYKFRLKEINIDGFAIKEVPLIEEKGSSIELSPTKPRPVDFAWASVRISVTEPKVQPSDLLKDSYIKTQKFGTTVYYKELSDPNYLKEYVVESGENEFKVKVYLNNSSTKNEFDPVINSVLENLEFY